MKFLFAKTAIAMICLNFNLNASNNIYGLICDGKYPIYLFGAKVIRNSNSMLLLLSFQTEDLINSNQLSFRFIDKEKNKLDIPNIKNDIEYLFLDQVEKEVFARSANSKFYMIVGGVLIDPSHFNADKLNDYIKEIGLGNLIYQSALVREYDHKKAYVIWNEKIIKLPEHEIYFLKKLFNFDNND